MFQGNLYFPLPLNVAVDLFADFDAAVENGLYSNPLSDTGELFCFSDEKTAVEVGKALYAANGAAVMPGARVHKPVLAVVHIGPIAPMALHGTQQREARITREHTALVLGTDAVGRIAKIVKLGSFAWNSVNMTMKVFTL